MQSLLTRGLAHMPVTRILSPLLISIAVIAAGCNGGGASPGASGGAAMVSVSEVELGRVLVDGGGRSLYLFEADTGTKSTCSGPCAAAWPPLLTSGSPTATGDAHSSKLGTTARDDGTTQVTYNGHPVYLYAGDKKAGDISGEGSDAFGAEWYLLSPDGNKVEEDSEGDES